MPRLASWRDRQIKAAISPEMLAWIESQALRTGQDESTLLLVNESRDIMRASVADFSPLH